MQRASATLAFVLLFSVLTGVLVVAAATVKEHRSPAEAMYDEYLLRVPDSYRSGRLHIELETLDERIVADTTFDDQRGIMHIVSQSSKRGREERLLTGQIDYLAAEAGYGLMLGEPRRADNADDWRLEPGRIRFREDPRAKALGAVQLIVQFPAAKADVTELVQLLTIDPQTYELLFVESSYGLWDTASRTWVTKTFRAIYDIDKPVTIPTAVP